MLLGDDAREVKIGCSRVGELRYDDEPTQWEWETARSFEVAALLTTIPTMGRGAGGSKRKMQTEDEGNDERVGRRRVCRVQGESGRKRKKVRGVGNAALSTRKAR
ncbi:unnamed protein product [Ilex paraguariensis]|uniref:Uncharacterized protein n=1 Tax=Ilex paraguariensis TaxID=185542 RepID=A0ABC8V563_9AQUA